MLKYLGERNHQVPESECVVRMTLAHPPLDKTAAKCKQ
jgi:hypothetical protein